MKPEFICDGCNESLRDKMKEGETIYIFSDSIGGFSVMDHHNYPNNIILCEECEEQVRDQLKEKEDWISLEQWDGFGGWWL